MADTTERPVPKAASDNASTPGATNTMGATVSNWANRLGLSRLLAPRPAAAPTATGPDGKPATTPPRSGMSRFIFGLLIFMIAAQFLPYPLFWLDNALFKGALNRTLVFPGVGWLSWFTLLYFALATGVFFLLRRYNIIPKDPYGLKAQAEARRQAAARPATPTSGGRNRAARRAAELAAATAPARGAKGAKGGSGAKGGAVARAGVKPTAALAAAGTSGKSATGAPRIASGDHDAAYQRVKAAQRARRRHEAKR